MIGFVYILTNPHFARGVYKIGCTERAPHARAQELSKDTAVPAPFEVVCYIEVDNFQAVEREIHLWLEHQRISTNREWFRGGLADALGWLWWYPNRLGFHSVFNPAETVGARESQLLLHLSINGHIETPDGPSFDWSISDFENPWQTPEQRQAQDEADVARAFAKREPLQVIVGGAP